MMVVSRREKLQIGGGCVLLRVDDSSAVQWISRCRRGQEPRARNTMGLLGVIEMGSDSYLEAAQARGVMNDVADCVSWWVLKSVTAELRSLSHDFLWQEQDLGS